MHHTFNMGIDSVAATRRFKRPHDELVGEVPEHRDGDHCGTPQHGCYDSHEFLHHRRGLPGMDRLWMFRILMIPRHRAKSLENLATGKRARHMLRGTAVLSFLPAFVEVSQALA